MEPFSIRVITFTVFIFKCITIDPILSLISLGFFVCDWYMNVDCEGSEKYYNLNDLIGDSMDGFTPKDVMSTAKDIMSFTKQPSSQAGSGGGSSLKGPEIGDRTSSGDSSNRRTGSSSGRPSSGAGPSTSSSSGLNGNVPLRGSANLAQPTGGSTYPSYNANGSKQGNGGRGATGIPSVSGSPYASNLPGRTQSDLQKAPQRGANGGTVYVNSLGQLSTDNGSGFDPKHSFILRPDKDSKFDQDPRIPSNSFDILKGIENSYSFGFPDDISTPLRGSADLSEPVDLSLFGQKNGAPGANGNRQKQIYTYPHDQNGYQQSSIPPEQQGQLNTKLAAQGPKYPATQVYGPALSQQGYPQEEYPGSSRAPSSQYPSSRGGSVDTNYPTAQRGPSSQGSQYPSSPSLQGSQYPGSPSSQGSLSPQGVPQRSQYTSSTGGKGYPSSAGGNSFPSSAGGNGFPSSAGGNGFPSSAGGNGFPSSAGGNGIPSTVGGSGFPSSAGGNGFPSSAGGNGYPSSAGGNGYPSSTGGNGYPASNGGVPQQSYSQQQQRIPQSQAPSRGQQALNGQRGPSPSSQTYSSPQSPFTQQTLRGPSSHASQGRPSSSTSPVQTPQKTLPQSYQPFVPRIDPSSPVQPQKLYQQPHGHRQSTNGLPQGFAPGPNQQQSQRRQFDNTPVDNKNYYQNPQNGHVSSGFTVSPGNSQSNEDYLRVVLKDKNNVHENPMQLIDLIQRFFHPPPTQTRVVSANVHPSREQESYSFTYDGNGAASNTRNSYQAPYHPGYHQHSNICGHQGY